LSGKKQPVIAMAQGGSLLTIWNLLLWVSLLEGPSLDWMPARREGIRWLRKL
jgi:hypothetical protein